MRLLNCAAEALGHCEVCRASYKAPHVPIAGTSAVSMLTKNCSLTCMRSMGTQSIPFSPPYARRTLGKFGTPSVESGWGSSGNLREFRWMKAGNGRV